MYDLASRTARMRGLVFAACVACTLWLVVQNAILFTLLPWDHLGGALRMTASATRALVIGVVALSLVAGAFGLGWWVSRRATGLGSHGEGVHD